MHIRNLCLLVCLAVNLLMASSSSSGESMPFPHPVWFEENSGQAPGDVAFIGHGFGALLFILRDGTLSLGAETHRVRLEPERGSALASVAGEAPTGAVTRTYAPGGTTVSRHYARVRVSNLWPGTDLFYRIRDGRLELGLDVMAGQTAHIPSLRWRGASARLDRQGCLHVLARGLRFTLRAPSASQPGGAVQVRYLLDGRGRLRFDVPDADPAQPLNIDPVFDFSTYIGGAQIDSLNAMALGTDGSIYVAGQTASSSLFGTSTGVRAGSGKVLVLRLAPGGVSIVYAAVFGGSYSDQGMGIAVDAAGAAYVTGYTDSPDFPVTSGAFQTAAQDWNAFAAKLDASGGLSYSTLLGGSGPDRGAAVTVDGSGRAVVTGQTSSADYPVTAQAYQRLYGGTQDCFVTMLAADGKSAVFSTFLGGSDLDSCSTVALGPSGAITVAGATRSSNFPVMGAFQAKAGGFLDGFVAQLNSTGSALVSSSYLGGIGQDQIASIAVDGSGYVYAGGTTSTQSGFPGTSAGVITKNGSGKKGFACKIAPSLVSLSWCSIVGGAGDDSVNALTLTPAGEIVVAGQTSSVNFPVVNAVQSAFQGTSDGWFAVLGSSGSQWETVSYAGGAGSNSVNAVQAFQDRILLAGSTTAPNLAGTSGGIQPSSGGSGDGFLQEIALGNGIILNGIYPASGTGFTHNLSFVITDPAGGSAVQTVQVNVSNPVSTASACVVTLAVASKTLSLANDAGTGSVGSAAAGANSTLQNSQCSVAAASSALSVAGNTIAVHLSLTYSSAFASVGAGATKYVSVSASDNQGTSLSVSPAATWTLTGQQPPTVVSLSPAAGQGAAQTFALTVADPAGASDLATVELLVGTSTAPVNACAVIYSRKQNLFALLNDSGTATAGTLAPGQATTVANSQCVLNGSGSSIQLSGNNLIMAVSLQFATAFAAVGGSAAKTIYALPLTASGLGPAGGITAVGTWTVPQPAPSGPPSVTSITPSSGQGASQSFSLAVSDPLGASDLATVQLLVGSSTAAANSCSVTYIAAQKVFALSSDAGTASAGTLAPGQASTVANSQCTLNGAGSSVTLSGNSLTMVVSLQFNAAFASMGSSATKNLYALPVNAAGQGPTGGMATVGTWTVPQTPVSGTPAVVSLSPSNGAGTLQAFTLAVSDSVGASDLGSVQILVGSSAKTASACAVTYSALQNSFSLANDAGTASAGSVIPGQTSTVSNSQCSLTGAGSSAQASGTTLTMTVNLQFNVAFASLGSSATKNVYVEPVNLAGQGPAGGYVVAGTWTVPQSVASGTVIPVSLAPASGQGMSQVFTLGSTDTAGASDIATVNLVFTGPLNLTNSCWVAYSAQKSAFGLVNDAASTYVGYVSPGQAASVSNSQCTLSGVGSAVQLSGNLLTMSVNITFNSSFATRGNGAVKTAYAFPVNAAGKGPTGFVSMGAWTLGQSLSSPPAVVSVAPSSGQGASQAFALTVSDPQGASDLATVQLLFNTSTATANACLVTYIAQQGTIALSNDAGTGYAGYVTPGQATTVSNSQCTLNGTGSSIQTSGNSLTVTANLQFTTAFAGTGGSATKNIYALPVNAAGQGPTGGLAGVGTWTVPQPVSPAPPSVGAITPSSGQGASQAFVLTVSDPAGASDLSSVQLLFGSSTALANACSITYSAKQNTFSLASDAGTSVAGSLTPGQATTVSNSQCTLSGAGSSVALSGSTLTMTVNLQFSGAFAALGTSATKNIYAEPLNSSGQGPTGGLVSVGTWTVPQTAGPPAIGSLSPATGTGTSASFVLTVSDSAGASDLASVQLLVGSSTALVNVCSVTYIARQNTFALTNDAGTGYAAYVTPGQSTTISNSQCTLVGSGSSVQLSGTTLTMTVSLQFAAAFAGAGNGPVKNVYALPLNAAGQGPSGGITLVGTWTVPQTQAGGPPTPVSLTPSSGTGSSQTFTLVVSDSAGATDVTTDHLIVSGPLTLLNACWVSYLASRSAFGLVNDAASGYVGYVAPGQAMSVSNSQCTLNGTGSTVQASGNLLTMTVNLTFKSGFSAVGNGKAKTVYAFPINAAGKGPTGLVPMGTWTLP